MEPFDKLRILWIDDCEGDHPKYQYPEPELPKEYEPYFTIIRHPRSGHSSTVRSPQEFSDIFGPFWAGIDHSAFPAEIIAMDYVLSKWNPNEVMARRDRKVENDFFDRADQTSRVGTLRTDTPKIEDGRIVGFEGLLIGVFYASLTCDYPAGLVPMTNYGDLMESVNEVRALHAMSKPLLDIDYSNFGVSGTNRSWRNVLSQGLKSLRYRITSLFISRRIILSLADIVAMKDSPDEAVLTIQSNYGMRRLPVAGVFADVTSDDRNRQIILWAEELLTEAGDEDPFETISEARTFAEQHWSRYLKDTNIIRERWKLSALLAKMDESKGLDEIESGQLQACLDLFGVKDIKARIPVTASSRIISICDDSKDGLITRWASVFVLARLIAHLMRAQMRLNGKSGAVSGSCFSQFCSRDWLYALMPSPESPLLLPAHHKGRNNPASPGGTLNRKLRRLNSAHLQATGDDNIGNCGFDCEHVFAGWAKDGSNLGLRPVERRLLGAAVMDHLVEAGQESKEISEIFARLAFVRGEQQSTLHKILRGAQA